jgi:hypothetical protein
MFWGVMGLTGFRAVRKRLLLIRGVLDPSADAEADDEKTAEGQQLAPDGQGETKHARTVRGDDARQHDTPERDGNAGDPGTRVGGDVLHGFKSGTMVT